MSQAQSFHPFEGEAHDKISAALTDVAKAIEHMEAFQALIESSLSDEQRADLGEYIQLLREAQSKVEHFGT